MTGETRPSNIYEAFTNHSCKLFISVCKMACLITCTPRHSETPTIHAYTHTETHTHTFQNSFLTGVERNRTPVLKGKQMEAQPSQWLMCKGKLPLSISSSLLPPPSQARPRTISTVFFPLSNSTPSPVCSCITVLSLRVLL